MIKEETWSVPMERAERFFQSQPDVAIRENGYTFLSCQITLKDLEPGQLGKIPFPRIRLHIEGPEEEVTIIHRRFLIQFLSAGG